MDVSEHLAKVRDERMTEGGRACVEIAAEVFKGDSDKASAEARGWIKLALEADKVEVDKGLALAEAKRRAKRKKRKGLAGLGRGNVVPIAR